MIQAKITMFPLYVQVTLIAGNGAESVYLRIHTKKTGHGQILGGRGKINTSLAEVSEPKKKQN